MRIAETKNVIRLSAAFAALRERESDECGMALVYGAPGLGKTVAVGRRFVQEKGLLLTALPGWTQRALLRALILELGSDFRGTNAEVLSECLRLLAAKNQPIFVDESDHLFGDSRSLESLRAIHDMVGTPIVLVGMNSLPSAPGIDRRVRRYPQLEGRITQWVEFQPADADDISEIARVCCDVPISPDLLARLLDQTGGNVRRIRWGLTRLQRFGKAKRLEIIQPADWGDREFFKAA